MRAWPRIVAFLVVGYLTMTRSFAYIGIPPLKLFIGEVAIGAFLLTRPRDIFDRWFTSLAEPSPLTPFAFAFTCSMAYGIFELIHGIALDRSPVLAIEGFAFHYYPLCFLIGIWAGTQDPTLLRRVIRALAWVNGIYGLLYIAFLNTIPLAIPGTDVRLIGQPAGSALVVIGLLSLEPQLSRVWHLILVNAAVMLGVQVRAEFLGLLVGLLVWVLFTRQFGRLFAGVAAVSTLLIVGYVSDFSIPAPSTRVGQISTRDTIGRVIAPIAPDLAEEYSGTAKTAAGTAEWRIVWWNAIWDHGNESTELAMFGEGYGYPLGDLVGYRERDIRTPHNVFFYAFAYGGWMGVVLFFLLQGSVAKVLWDAAKISGTPVGLATWAMFLCGAFFSNAFEAPFGAIPFYLLIGMAAAPAMRRIEYASPVSAQLLPAARW
ncbi:MAG TPA: O-antigen ligase family protein [Bryobacteraceae bacterium]|nr:O-antigen ligase family protein [Bryobacteraceae bacterium]